MKILSHASAKKKPETIKVSNVTLLLVIFKCHHDSEGLRAQEQCEQKLGLGSLSFPIPVGLKQTAGHDRVD